jgi:MFS family permease
MQQAAVEGGQVTMVSANPLTWLREMSKSELSALKACWAGWALDGMDTQMYSFIIPSIITIFGITRSDAGLVSTTVLLTSAIGGWIAGYLSDRIGRVKTLQLTIAWFAVFSMLSGLAMNFNQLLIARALMGLGFGGEYAAGAVLLSETMSDNRRGKALGIMASASAVGWGAAALLFTLFYAVATPEIAWRALLVVGLLPALLIFFVRRYVKEPEIYRESQKDSAKRASSFVEIFRPHLLRRTVFSASLAMGAQGAYVTIMTWLPTFLIQERGLSSTSAGGYLIVTTTGAFFGYLTGAALSDAIGRRPSFLVFGLAAFAVILLYTFVSVNPIVLLVLGFPVGFFLSGAFSVMPAFFTETFPTYCRGLGLGFVHNFGRAAGALFPFLVGLFSDRLGLGLAIGLFSASGLAFMLLFTFALPETRGRSLTENV